MVFESYVVDLLNKFAGQYLQNLDASQLTLGIWGGDAQLENLILKDSALDDLDLPVKVLRGHLGKLVLKIPWKNLYSEPVVAKVDGLYLLVRPNTVVKYNAEKEEKAKQEKKQRQLEAVDLARQLEEEKKKSVTKKDEKSDSFVEKLAMQIVKNLQISVCNIHIRYEDSVTNPSAPFSIGVTLENLSAESTDENWIPSIVGKSVQLIHKLVKLDSLALYWNTHDGIGKLPTQEDWVNQAKGGIATRTSQHYSPPYKYILQPISAETKVKLNVKAGSDLSIPKAFLSLVLQEISLVLMRQQYHDVMQLLESFDRMTTNSAFRKYKPNEPLAGHAKQWWMYAVTSILEEDVRRRLRNWSWDHIKKHRALCRRYKELYKQRLLKDKVSDSVSKEMKKLEETLDVLNITICRQQAAFEEAAALRRKKEKAEGKKKSGRWFSGWLGSKTKGKKEEEKSEILTEEQKKEELEKLYAAIGYSEGEVITAFPKEYVENKVSVHLKQISVALRDDTGVKQVEVSRLCFQDLFANVSQRPSAQAIKITARVDQIKMFGSTTVDGKMPLMITSQDDQSKSHLALFTAAFETNPLDGKCDQRAEVSSQPLKIIYDANTIQHVINFFEPPKDVHLQELSAAAYSRLEDLKSVSKASLAYAVEHHKITDVNVDVKSPFIIIPEHGVFTESSSVLVVDLGHLKITSDPDQERIISTKELSVEELESMSYDKFDIRLEDLLILVARSGRDWQAARKQTKSDMHILDPVGFNMKLQKALNPDDIRLAQIKVSGILPSVNFHVSDDKLAEVIKLAKSLPIPSGGEISLDQVDTKPVDIKFEGRQYASSGLEAPVTGLRVLSSDDQGEADDEEHFKTPPETLSEEFKLENVRKQAKEALAKQVKLSLKFEIEEISVDVGTADDSGKTRPCLVLSIRSLGTRVTMHPWDIVANASLGSLALQEMGHGAQGTPLNLVQTPPGAELLSVDLVKVEPEHPEYNTTYKSTQQSVALEFSLLQVVLHQEALLDIMELSGKMLPASEENALSGVTEGGKQTSDQEVSKSSHTAAKKAKKKGDNNDEVQLQVTAKLRGINVTVTSVDGDLSCVIIGGLSAYCAMNASRTEVTASMKNLSVFDSTPGALYPKIVSIVNQDVFHLEVVAYNGATSGSSFKNMEAVDVKFQVVIGCIRVVFLNKFVMNILAFLNKFQRAKDALEYARKSATESAAATIQSLQTQSSRVSLSVSIQAPLIIIPMSSTSHNALVANLGHLTVSNSFVLLRDGEDSSGSDAVVIDNMVVDLSSVQLLRAVMADAETIGATRLVLEPVNLAVYIARNLSPWYHQVPDIDVVGKLHAVKLNAGEDDIRTLLGIVFQNLSEGANITETEPSIVQEATVLDTQQLPDSEDSTTTVNVQRAVSEEPWNTVKFSFEIEEVSAAVYWKEAGPPSREKTTREPANCLGQFSLSHITTSGRIRSDSFITACVLLESCVLDDRRPQSEQGVTRMIERFTGGSSDVKNMIDVDYQQSTTQDKTIVIGIQNFHVVVNLEFLLFLSNVFTSALTDSPDSNLTSTIKEPSKAIPKPLPLELKTANEEPPQVNVQIFIRDPEIVLLADAKDKDTNALFLKNAVDFHFVQGQGQQKMSGCVSDLVIFSAAFDKERRDSSKSRVLQLSQISLLSSAPEGSNMHIDISTAMAYIHVSPPTIRTLTACLNSLAPAKCEEDKEKCSEDTLELWSEQPISAADRWYLTPVAEDQLVPGRRVIARSMTDQHKYQSGYIIRMLDLMIMVQYDESFFTIIDPNDLTAVVVDRDPKPRDVSSGSEVIAKCPKESFYIPGKVIKTNLEKGQHFFLIDFWDGVERWSTLQEVRVLTTSKPGVHKGQIVVSTIVFVRDADEAYMKGFVCSKTYSKLVVRLFVGGHVTVDVNDSAAIVPDVLPDRGALNVGSTVIATFDRSLWQAGNIAEIKKLEGSDQEIYRVRFIGGGDTWIFNLNNIRVLMTRKREVPQGVLAVGTVVWAHTSKIRYYKGFVSYKGTKVHVDLYDGDKFLYDVKDAMCRVIPDVPPRVADIKPGTRVIAKFKNKPRYYSSTVMEVDASDPNEPKYHVKLDDGDETWDSLYHLRLLPKQVQVGGVEKPPDHVEAAEAGNSKAELMVFEMEGFSIKMEGMFGGQMIPLLSIDGSMQGEVKNWSSALSARAGISLIGNYFNEHVSEWESLIEPVEDEKQVYRPWELSVEFSMANGDSELDKGSNLDDTSEAAMTLAVESKDLLELTVTKSCLGVITKLGAAFGEAVALQGTGVLALEDIPPYQIWNELGLEIKIRPGNKFVAQTIGDDGLIALPPGQSLSLRFAKGVDRKRSRYDRGSSSSGVGPSIGIEVQGYHELKTISIKQARIVLHNIIPKKLLAGLIASVVIQVETGEGQKIVTIRSPLQVSNHFPIPMEVHCKKEEHLSRIATIQPDSVFSVPLILAHRAALFLRPAGFGYGESTSPLLWNKLASEGHSSVVCPPPAGEGPPFHIEGDCEKVSFSAVQGSLEHAPNYILHIYPPAILHNYLPYTVHYATEGLPFLELKGGDKWPLFSVNLSKKVFLLIQIDGYHQSCWKGQIELSKGLDELTTCSLESTTPDTYGKLLELGVFATFEGTMNITLYSPYWMVNKTDLYLEYKASDDDTVIPHPVSMKEPVMFSYHGKGKLFAKKTARVRTVGSDWSNKFSLDAAGSGGALKVTRDGKLLEVGMQITLSYFSLTKIVEFTPFHLINNHTEYPVSLSDSEENVISSWITVQPGECSPFWPKSCPSKNLVLKVGDSSEQSARFNFEPDVTVLLRMNGKVGAVCAQMLTKDSAAIVTIAPYYSGAAPVRLENCTPLEICYQQKGCKQHVLHPNHSVLFSWDEPTIAHEFVWSVHGSDNETNTDLTKLDQKEFEVDGKKFYWATFLDGLQRVLLIIEDFTLAYRAQVEQKERTSQQITLGLQGVGLSLVNNEKSIEVAYIGLKPSAVIWEAQKKGRWKPLKLRLCDEFEAVWSKIEQDLSVGAEPNYIYKTADMEVDFHLLEIVRPSRQPIRRTFTPGVSIEYMMSPNQVQLFAKINSVQIDSQVPGSTFQTVLFPIPPPKSLAAENAPKPYIELSLVTKQEEHSRVNEIKYFKVLIQEMDAKVDMGFLMALMGLLSSDSIDRSQEASQYSLDKQRVHDKLGEAFAVQSALSDNRTFLDYFHLSPLKIHLSFSQLGGAAEDDNAHTRVGNSFLNLLLQSVGVAVTEVQDVEFKLAYFEVKKQVYTQQQLIQVATKHYSSQALKQMYVLVLGLDVLGNPFGLITGLKDGAKDFFYEPYQGLIQGPGEFAEGLAIGARSLFGHTVGGAAGAVSRITGTLGKGIAALTLDDKYKQERRQAMGKKPVNVKEGLTRGGKGLLEGVVGGVTGIVTKPMEGAKEAGAAGFFKGLGKGVVGVLARPAGGLVDFASSTLEGIKGSASTGSDVKRIRPPRCFYADKVIKPYNLHEAQGNAVLQEVKKDKAALVNDTYFCHCRLNIKKALIITNAHIIVAGKSEVFEIWECDWMCAVQELTQDPITDGQKLVLKVQDKGKGKGIFKRSSSSVVRTIQTPSAQVAQWLVGKIQETRS